jgi:hypothetical protein
MLTRSHSMCANMCPTACFHQLHHGTVSTPSMLLLKPGIMFLCFASRFYPLTGKCDLGKIRILNGQVLNNNINRIHGIITDGGKAVSDCLIYILRSPPLTAAMYAHLSCRQTLFQIMQPLHSLYDQRRFLNWANSSPALKSALKPLLLLPDVKSSLHGKRLELQKVQFIFENRHLHSLLTQIYL